MYATSGLLIVHRPGSQALSDWTTVRDLIAARAPDIAVQVASMPEAVERARAADPGPLFVLAVHQLDDPWPGQGRVYTGIAHDKIVQYRRLAMARLPTPQTLRVTRAHRIDPSTWGEYTIVKPSQGHLGHALRLVRTADLPRLAAQLPEEVRQQFIIQPYIEHADEEERPYEYRVLTFFGRLLYSTRNRWPLARRPLAEIATSPRGLIASNDESLGQRERALCDEPDVIALALRAAVVFRELPSLAVDIVRDRNTGGLSILEVNPKGESWHLSSDFAIRTFPPGHRAALYAQHDALSVVADALIARTRAEAL